MNNTESNEHLGLRKKYEMLEELGRGGFGVVHKARQKATGQIVAVKQQLSSLHCSGAEKKERQGRFLREIKLIGALQSPYIVKLLDGGFDETGLPYMVLEFIKGQDLSDLIEHGPLSSSQTRRIILQVLEALAEAHELGIIHRDLKPDNIMLLGTGSRMTAKVLDFGISGVIETQTGGFDVTGDEPIVDDALKVGKITEMGQIRGTPSYMAPEQMMYFYEPKAHTDVYAMGLILYECLTGIRAMDGDSAQEICFKQINASIDIPADFKNTEWEAILDKACNKDPEKRFSSALEMLHAVQRMDAVSLDSVNITGASSFGDFWTAETGNLDEHIALQTLAPPTEVPPPNMSLAGASQVTGSSVDTLQAEIDAPECSPFKKSPLGIFILIGASFLIAISGWFIFSGNPDSSDSGNNSQASAGSEPIAGEENLLSPSAVVSSGQIASQADLGKKIITAEKEGAGTLSKDINEGGSAGEGDQIAINTVQVQEGKSDPLIKAALKPDPAPDALEVRVENVRRLFGEKNYEKVVSESISILEIEPASLEVKLYQAQSLLALKKYKSSTEAFQLTLEHEEYNEASLIGLARAYQKSRKKKKASKYYKEYLKKYPDGEFRREAKKTIFKNKKEGRPKVVPVPKAKSESPPEKKAPKTDTDGKITEKKKWDENGKLIQ